MNAASPKVRGLGIGWRPELALDIERRSDLGFVEMLAEDFDPLGDDCLPLRRLRNRGVQVVVHGVSLSLGGAEPLSASRLDRLARLAERYASPLISEHVAFVRGGGRETGHLMPVPRTRDSLELLVANIREAQAALPVPLAVENIASLVEWPDAEMTEPQFLTELLDRTGAWLLLDLENVYANSRNRGFDPIEFLEQLPLERVAYAHVAGGVERSGVYHDTHAHAVPPAVLELVAWFAGRYLGQGTAPGVMLERDDRFPSSEQLDAELTAIAAAMADGRVVSSEVPHDAVG
ncbi:MAG TPA: DUF692 domain-containing protein [Pirellulaceae bacterium]|nr:DUF692 domain-containing protein [Pirellulaceae bacterium]